MFGASEADLQQTKLNKIRIIAPSK